MDTLKIVVKNIRCYEDQTFEFTDGMTLISGTSGIGKTTIFMAITFAILGVGNNLITSGKNTCSVELSYKNIKIKRSKRPNHLMVTQNNMKFENESAQEVINRFFGESFFTTAYIHQNGLNSFILMRPNEKLTFLETFAFKHIDLEKLHEKSKENIYIKSDHLKKTTSQLELAVQTLSNLTEPTVVSFPIKCSSEKQELFEKNENIKLKNCTIRIKKAQKVISEAEKELSDIRHLLKNEEANKESIDLLKIKLQNIEIDLKSLNYSGDDSLSILKKKLANSINLRSLKNLQNSYETVSISLTEMKNQEIKELQNNISSIQDSLWSDYTKDELESLITEQTSLKDILKQLTSYKNEYEVIGDITDEILKFEIQIDKDNKSIKENLELIEKIYKLKEVYNCPNCHIKLKLENNSLVTFNEIINSDEEIDISKLKFETNNLQKSLNANEKKLQNMELKSKRKNELYNLIQEIESSYDLSSISIEEIDADLTYLQTYKATQNASEKNLKSLQQKLTNNVFSSSLMSFERKVNKQLDQINSLKEMLGSDSMLLTEEEDVLRKMIKNEEDTKTKIDHLQIMKIDIEHNINTLNLRIQNEIEQHLKKYQQRRYEDDITKDITENRNSIKEYENEILLHQNNLKLIEDFKIYKRNMEFYNSWKIKVESLTFEESQAKKKHSASLMLREKILEAESIAMTNIINTINSHAQIYLDAFFNDNPITVVLVAFKEAKTKKTVSKPQINIEINFKDMEKCDIDSLSGGELARVILAFNLALAEIFQTPMILLDESTSALDQELTTTVFESIKENFKDKMILVIAHQVTSGMFDNILKM